MSETAPINATDPRPARVGFQIPPQHATWAQIRSLAVTLEELGADILFTWDHFFPLSGDRDGAHFEAWTILAAWAEGHRAGRDRLPRHGQLLPQPQPAGRRGTDR